MRAEHVAADVSNPTDGSEKGKWQQQITTDKVTVVVRQTWQPHFWEWTRMTEKAIHSHAPDQNMHHLKNRDCSICTDRAMGVHPTRPNVCMTPAQMYKFNGEDGAISP